MPKQPIQVKVKFETAKFNKCLAAVRASCGIAARPVVRMAALELMGKTMKAWPVDSGRSRAAWYPIFDALKVPGPASRGSSASAIAEGKAQGSFSEGGGLNSPTAKMVNGVDYSPSLEAGWSKQAPTGALRNAMAEMRRDIGKSPKVRKFIAGLRGVRKGVPVA